MSSSLTWRDLLNDWCENARRGERIAGPPPLVEFWLAGGAAALSRQNRFQVPEDHGGFSVFYVENQHVCTWAYRTDDASDDPAVYVCEHVAAASDYVPVGCRLDSFLSAAAVIESALGSTLGRAAEGPTAHSDEVLGIARVELPEIGWPPGVSTSYFAGEDLLAFVQDEAGHCFAFISARDPEALRHIDERIATHPSWEMN